MSYFVGERTGRSLVHGNASSFTNHVQVTGCRTGGGLWGWGGGVGGVGVCGGVSVCVCATCSPEQSAGEEMDLCFL